MFVKLLKLTAKLARGRGKDLSTPPRIKDADPRGHGRRHAYRVLFSRKKVDIFEKLFNFHRRKCQFLEKNSTIQKSNSENKKVVVFILVVKMTELW